MTKEIAKELHKQLGFGNKPDENGLYWKGLAADKMSLYFGDWKGNGTMVIGIYAEGKVSATLMDNLKVEFHNCISGKYCGDPILDKDDYSYDIHVDISLVNDSTLDWAVSAIGELERRANFTLTR